MSYDFYMTIDVGGKYDVRVFDDLNYTYNVADMFRRSLELQDGVNDLDGLTGRECILHLERGISNMRNDPKKYKSMNPPNGWGDYDGALLTLKVLLDWCIEAPLATMRVA